MLGIILVNYKSVDETVSYVRDQLSKITLPYKVVIVNNACSDEVNQQLVDRLSGQLVNSIHSPVLPDHQIYVLAESENLGYAKGNNLGFKFLDKHFETDWVLITNNDLIFEEGGVVEGLVRLASAKNDIGVIGPRIRTTAGKPQSPHRRLSIWNQLIFPKLLYPIWAVFRRMGATTEVVKNASSGYYFRIMGCFLLVRTTAFRKCDGFDPGTFLYGEELNLSARMRQNGFGTFFSAEQTVIHHHRQTTSNYMTLRNVKQQTLHSLLIYYRNYEDQPEWVCGLAKASDWVESNVYAPVIHHLRNIFALCRRRH